MNAWAGTGFSDALLAQHGQRAVSPRPAAAESLGNFANVLRPIHQDPGNTLLDVLAIGNRGRFQRLELALDEAIEFVEIGDEVGRQGEIQGVSPGKCRLL